MNERRKRGHRFFSLVLRLTKGCMEEMEFEEGLEKKEECGFAANLLDKQGMRASSKTSLGSHFLLSEKR